MVNFSPFVLLFLLNMANCHSLKRTEIGEPCETTQQCKDGLGGALSDCVANAEGVKICQCIAEAVPIEVGLGFLCEPKATTIGDPCVFYTQCTANLGDLSDCIDGLCTCKEGAIESDDRKRCLPNGGALIGERCAADADCVGDPGTSHCSSSGVCTCLSGHVPSQNRENCLPIRNQIGDPCLETKQCQEGLLGSFSICSINQICKCSSEAITAPGIDACLLKALLVGDACEVDLQCTENLSDLSFCVADTKKCECKPGSIPNEDRTECVEDDGSGGVHIGSPCEADVQCVGDPGTSSQCFSGICSCMPGYISANNLENCLQIRNDLGDECVESQQCRQGQLGQLSMCRAISPPNKVCNCIPAAVAEPGDNFCRRKATFVGDTCEVQSQCLANLHYSRCTGGFCICLGDAVPSDDLSECHI